MEGRPIKHRYIHRRKIKAERSKVKVKRKTARTKKLNVKKKKRMPIIKSIRGNIMRKARNIHDAITGKFYCVFSVCDFIRDILA